MWSQLGRNLLQVAADAAQNLAQPQEEGADDDEYYEEDEEGEGWDDGLEDLGDEDGTPVEGEEGQYYATGDDQDQAGYYEGGEEQQEEGQYAYQGEEEQPYNEEEEYGAEEQEGWAEEEVDFSLDAEQETNEATTTQDDPPLFGGEPQEQLAFDEPVVPNADDWDLEDELLFDEEGATETQNNTQEEEPQQEVENQGTGLEAPVFDSVENDWNDDSLNFDDSHVVEEETLTPPQLTVGTVPATNDDVDDNPVDLGNAWDQDVIALDEPSEEPAVESSAQEDPFVARQSLQETIETATEEGAGWGDDLDALNASGIDAEEAGEDPGASGVETQETFETATEEEAAGWDDDLDVDALNSSGIDAEIADQASRTEMAESGDTGTALEDSPTGDANDLNQEPQSKENEGDHNEWGMDDLNLSSQHEDADLDTPQVPADNVSNETTTLKDNSDPLPAAQPSTADIDVNADAWGDDNDDLNFSGHQETMDPSPPQPSDAAAIPEDDAWDGDDDLNLSDHNDNVGVETQGDNATDIDSATDISAPILTSVVSEHEQPIDDGNAWGDDDLDISANIDNDADLPAQPDANDIVDKDGLEQDLSLEEEVNVDEDAWNDSAFNLDEDELKEELVENQNATTAVAAQSFDQSEEVDDDCTVERSNIGFEQQSSDDGLRDGKQSASDDERDAELQFVGRTPSRRATIRASNTSSAIISRKGSEDEDSAVMSEKVIGTSVMFAEDFAVEEKEKDGGGQSSLEDIIVETKPSEDAADSDITSQVQTSGMDKEAPSEVSVARDTVSSVSGDSAAEPPKPRFQTQISMMTLKSIADSCPSSRGRDNDSDEDDEDGFGPVVDKTPELDADANRMPELSTMTINSTAVAAHSVGDDIQRDDEMDGTYYGGSTTGEGQSKGSGWEDDASLGEMNDLSEKIVNFELAGENDPIDTSAAQPDALIAPLDAIVQEEAVISSPHMDSSMANLYTDDNSVPSRDKDDDNEDNYKKVVDQIPKPLKKKLVTEKSGRTLNSMAVFSDSQENGKNDESTAEKEPVGNEKNGWEDSFLGDIKLDEEGSQDEDEDDDPDDDAGSTPKAGQVVIDNTPVDAFSTVWKSGGSLAAVESADNSCPSRVHDSDDEQVYGPVVDQIPATPAPLLDQMSVTASSVAVVAHNVEEDLKQDEELDASDHGGSTVDGLGISSGWENDCDAIDDLVARDRIDDNASESAPSGGLVAKDEQGADVADMNTSNDRMVDLTPKIAGKKVSRLSSVSLAVLAHSVVQDYEDENDDEDEDDANFGPIVDITPTPHNIPATPGSTAAQATNIGDDIKQDEITEGGVGDVNWDDECPELEDVESGLEGEEDDAESGVHKNDDPAPADNNNGQAGQSSVVLVDHTPEGEVHRKRAKGDASLAVLAPSEDGTVASMNDDDDVDTIDPHGERVSFGPIVDITPTLRMQPMGERSTAPSVTFSLAVEARSVEEDYNLDDEMDETFCGDTTLGGETGWGDDQTLDDLDTDASINRAASSSAYRFQTKKQGERDRNEVMVDHTPQPDTPQSRIGDASLVALAPSEEDSYRSADDADSAIDDDTITHEDGMMYGNVVDHTPSLAPLPLVSTNSMAVGASSADFRSEMEREEDLDATLGDTIGAVDENDGWDEDEEALDEIESQMQPEVVQAAGENVVDHTPVADEEPKPGIVDPSVAVLAPSEDGSEDEGDNDTCNDNQVFGPMVDITPQQPPDTGSVAMPGSVSAAARHEGELDGTLFGDSTVGGETGWDEDDAILDDLVEEGKESTSVIVEPLSNANSWQHSAELISDNASSHLGGSVVGKSSQDGVVLVDHTPSEIDSSVQKNSVAWLLNVESGISEDETDDAGVSWRGNEPVAIPEVPAEEDQVVDHIPHGAASRFGDASTLVVADPSEVLSHVGDMLQEEGDFGPVVDLTPPSRPGHLVPVISAAGSTAVVAPTVGPDDLDADPDDTVVNAEDNGWEQDASELEQAPNPQSGNEEEIAAAAAARARVREQVVDFVPPVGDRHRDGRSTVATGGAPSVLQADPKEDEFGPVVDQLPAPHPSTPFAAISTSSQVASSECDALAGEDETDRASAGASAAASAITEDASNQGRNPGVLVDPLPRPFEVALQNLDSTASLAQSSDDEDDDIKNYGPVVDHLPSIRSSLPPSRGGSTVDALATVSEVIDDDDDGSDGSSDGSSGNNGWGDDDLGEIDLSERHENVTPSQGDEANDRSNDQNSNQGERGMTVRFRSVVAAIFESSSDNGKPQSNLSSSNAAPHQIFHDDHEADADEPSAWDDDIDFNVTFDVGSNANGADDGNDRAMMMTPERFAQFSEADTPPATPYSRDKVAHREPNGLPPPVTLPDFGSTGNPPKLSMQCNSCANASSVDCPCVQRILKGKDEGDDDAIKVDYNKLLQTEITKRRLIEEEANDLRQRLDTLKNSKTAGEVRMETVQTLQEHVKVIEEKLKEVGASREALRKENQELKASLASARTTLSALEGQREQWIAKEAALAQESERTRLALNESLAQAKKNQELNEQELKTELESKQQFADGLSRQLGTLQEESSRLRTENTSLMSDVQSFRESLEGKEREIARLLAQESQFEVETKELKEMIAELEMASSSAEELQELYKEVESELVAKDSLCDQLRNDIALLEQRLQDAEAARHKLENERASLRKQHEDDIAGKQVQMASLEKRLHGLRNLRSQPSWKEAEVESQVVLQNEIDELYEEEQAREAEPSTLQNELDALYEDDDDEEQAGAAESMLQKEIDGLYEEEQAREAEPATLQDALNALYDDEEEEGQTSEAQQPRDIQSSVEEAMSEMRLELDMKQQELQTATEQLNYLREQNSQLEAGLEELESLSAKARSLEDELRATCEERDAVKNALLESNEMVTRMQQRIDDQGIEESAMIQNKNKEIEALIAERAQLRNEAIASSQTIEALEQRSAGLDQEKTALEMKISELTQSCEDFKTLAENSRVDAVDATEHLSKILTEFESLQQEAAEIESEREAVESDRQNMLSRITELESALNSAFQDVSQGAEKTNELTTLLSERQQEINALRNDQNAVVAERDQFRVKCNDLEALLSGKTQESQELSRLMQENGSLFEQLNAVQQEMGHQNIILQNFEARAAALENELIEERNDGATKDGTIAGLRGELKSARQSLELSTEGANKLPERIAELEAIVSRFEAERGEFDRRVEVLVAKEQELHERNESLAQDRSRVLSDREGLAQENEEMLVQFGLLNEQMDSYREQVQELQQLLQSYEQTSAIADAKVLELQQRLVSAETAQQESSQQFGYQAEEKERELASIRNEQARLMREIQELSEANSEKDDTIDSLTYELDDVKSQLVAFEELKAQSDFVSNENEELHSKIEDLEVQHGELAANVESQQETISSLTNDLDETRAAALSSEHQVKMLEEACSDRDDALQRKEGEIREMVGRLHASGGSSSSESGEEILNLRTRLEQMDTHYQETVDHMHKLTADYDVAQEELASTRAQLDALQNSVQQLEQELAQKGEDAYQQSEDQENQILTLENKLQDKKREVAELTSRSSTLSNEVEELRTELNTVREQSLASATAEAESAENELLKERVRSLEEELEATKSSSKELEESLQAEINGLKRRMGTKDGEVLMLKNKVEELRGDAQSSRDQVEGKVVELQLLATEMDNMRRQQESLPERGQNISAVDLLEQSKENAEDVENLRSTVISLATALETSENLRADAIDRLLKERETYASSLRHFSDSVKRFYNTLSFNES